MKEASRTRCQSTAASAKEILDIANYLLDINLPYPGLRSRRQIDRDFYTKTPRSRRSDRHPETSRHTRSRRAGEIRPDNAHPRSN
jgi:hypothetical protein